MPLFRKKYAAHAVILGSAVLLVNLGLMLNSGVIGRFIGAAAGAFSLNDPLILLFCIALGLTWRGRHNVLWLVVLTGNAIYRIALLVLGHSHLGMFVLILFASSYGALVLTYLVLAAREVWRAIKNAPAPQSPGQGA